LRLAHLGREDNGMRDHGVEGDILQLPLGELCCHTWNALCQEAQQLVTEMRSLQRAVVNVLAVLTVQPP
jgi:hypothetical protein